MRLYSAGAFMKIIIGVSILSILYHYVNIYQDPAVGLSFGFLGLFMIIWGASYYLFLTFYRFFSLKPRYMQASMSYKLSLLIGIYAMINLTLVITDHRSKFIGFAILIGFIIIQTLFFYEKRDLEY